MDVNEYMKQSLSLLERITEGIETLNANGVHVTNFVLPEGPDLKAVGSVVHAQPAENAEADKKAKADAKAKKAADEKAAKDKDEADAYAKAKKAADEADAYVKAKKAADEKAAKDKYKADADAKAEADKKYKADADAKAEADEKAKQDAAAANKPAETETKAKKVTADDARKALKAYAAIEGNDAAMELLTSLGAGSVSALAEQGDDKLAELVAKCGG